MKASFDLKTAWPVEAVGGCSSLKQYLDWVSELQQRGYRPSFRGVSRCYGNLWSSLDRRVIKGDAVEVETGLLSEFLERTREYLTPQEKVRHLLAEVRWGKRNTGAMVVARHRLVPTRCLDWSYSHLCALFFACFNHPDVDGEIWWFDRNQFDSCVAAQWPSLYGKMVHVEDDLERDFVAGRDAMWFTAFDYMLLPGDRMDRQKAWMTVAGRLGTCHAEEIHRIGVRSKGRLRIPHTMKNEAMRLFEELDITKQSLGLVDDHADSIARELHDDFMRQHPIERDARTEGIPCPCVAISK